MTSTPLTTATIILMMTPSTTSLLLLRRRLHNHRQTSSPQFLLITDHGVHSPRPFQIDAIFQLCIRRVSMLYLIRKTGEGKSLVLKGMATIKCGITLCLVPLVGLGSDQAIKTTRMTCSVEAYHVDEWKDDRCDLLMNRMILIRKIYNMSKLELCT